MTSRKYTTKHPDRGKSNYPGRLGKRGVSSASVRMTSLEQLQSTQESREKRTGSPWPDMASDVDEDEEIRLTPREVEQIDEALEQPAVIKPRLAEFLAEDDTIFAGEGVRSA